MDEDAREEAEPAGRKAGRRWRRRLGVALVVVIAAVPIGLQVQTASERGEAAHREAIQRRAEHDERAAEGRLASVNTRVLTARAQQDAAQEELDRARTDMTANGLDEAGLGKVQGETAQRVRDLRGQGAALSAAVTEQKRLQPAASSCIFDLLQALGRVRLSHDADTPAGPCATVASHSPGPG